MCSVFKIQMMLVAQEKYDVSWCPSHSGRAVDIGKSVRGYALAKELANLEELVGFGSEVAHADL